MHLVVFSISVCAFSACRCKGDRGIGVIRVWLFIFLYGLSLLGFADKANVEVFSTDAMLEVSASKHTMFLIKKGRVIKKYTIRTSRYGLGEAEHSGKTPRGWMLIKEKIGHNQPPYMYFQSRKPIKEVPQHERNKRTGYIVTRILRLTGLEPGFNQGYRVDADSGGVPIHVDTWDRMIYIHGITGPIEPATEIDSNKKIPAGCIVMRPNDMIDLFKRVSEGTRVLVRD